MAVPPTRAERRIYLGDGVWETMDGTPVTPPPARLAPPTGSAAGRPAPAGAAGPATRQHLSLRWPLQVLLTLPLVWGGAIASGLGVYFIALAMTVGDPGLSDLILLLLGVGALATALVLTLACGVLLRERPRGRLSVVMLLVAASGAIAAALLAVLGYAALPCIGVAALLGYSVAALALFWVLPSPAPGGTVGAVMSPPVVDESGRRWVQVGAPGTGPAHGAGSGALPGAGVWMDTPARWSWDAHVEDSARSPAWFAVGVVGALILTAAAVAVGFAAFSLFAESFVAGQAELGWQDTLLSTVSNGSGGGGALGVVTLLLANLGCAALFGLLTWAAAVCVGGWRGRIAWRWGIVLGVLLVAGVVAWLLDGSLPHL